MTEAQAQTILANLYDGSATAPDTTDTDYTYRLNLLNVGIQVHENEKTDWNELYDTLAAAADGTKTTTAGTASYSTPTKFQHIVGYARIDDENGTEVEYPIVPVWKVQLYINDTASRFAYITGNTSSGYKVNFRPTPTASSRDINYEFYKTATLLTAPDSKFEMSDPYFAIYYALSVMFENDGEGDRATKALAQANDRLRLMKLRNVELGYLQDSTVHDQDYETGVGGFGQ